VSNAFTLIRAEESGSAVLSTPKQRLSANGLHQLVDEPRAGFGCNVLLVFIDV
jgi:hypothetical protein